MKLLATIILSSIISLSGYSQSEPNKKLPPMKMLPKAGEVKQIYELTEKAEYNIFDSKGKLITTGNAQFIDYSEYKKGTYFIQIVGGKKESFEKK